MAYPYTLGAANGVLRAAESLVDELAKVRFPTPKEADLVEAVNAYRAAAAREQPVIAKEPGD